MSEKDDTIDNLEAAIEIFKDNKYELEQEIHLKTIRVAQIERDIKVIKGLLESYHNTKK